MMRRVDSPSNAVVATRVNVALLRDPRTNRSAIDVRNVRGIVTLSGTVASEDVRQAAVQIALAQQGVAIVINSLAVGR